MIQAYKDAFNYGNELIHLNNAGLTPWPKPTKEALKMWTDRMASEGMHRAGETWVIADQTRLRLGRVLGASASQIAFFQTCANAISQVAFGMKLNAGDEVIIWDQEYPSNYFPWKIATDRAQGKLVVAKSDPSLATPVETIERLITPRTKVIAVSWVQYRSGATTDLEKLSKLARAHGIFTSVDIIQGAGVLPFDFNALGIDAACGGSHKWLTSPDSLGFLVMKPEHLDTFTPVTVGANTYGGPDVVEREDAKMLKGFQRFEPGGRSALELIGLTESLRLIESLVPQTVMSQGLGHSSSLVSSLASSLASSTDNTAAVNGIALIAHEAQSLAQRLSNGLKDLRYTLNSWSPEQTGPILNFSPNAQSPLKTIDDIDQRFLSARISYSKRAPGIRLSPHAFLSESHIDRVLEALS